MKTKISLVTVVTLCLLFLFSGCEEAELQNNTQLAFNSRSKDPGVYPMSKSSTRSGEGGYWESWNFIRLNNGIEVQTPWNPTSTVSDVPHDILEDIKYIDGWDLIYHLLEDNSGGSYTRNSPYLIFHNRYTGILKVFCYMSSESFSPTNYGIWQVNMNRPSSLFAFQNYPISRISEKQNDTYYVSNITNNATRGFSIGWNCFQIELAYDPSQSGWLNISTLAKNISKLNLSGNLESHTEGLMTTSKGDGNYGSGIAKVAGKEASAWITDKIHDKTILGIPTSIVSEDVKALVSSGVGSLINAFTGLFKSDNSSKSIQLTTNGTFSIDGELNFESTTGIPSIDINLDPDSVGYLGVWGLRDEPTLLFSPYAIYKSPQEYTNGYTREYNLNIVNSGARASVVLNPNLSRYVQNSSISTTYYQSGSYTRIDIWGRTGVLGRDPRYRVQVYDNLYKPNFNIIADVAFLGDEDVHLPIDQFEPPMEVFIPNVPNGPQGAVPSFRYNSRYVASIGVKLTLPNGSEAYSYHQCFPKIDWNLSEYNNGLYWSFYPCEPVTRINMNSFSTTLQDKSLNDALHISDKVLSR